MTPSSPTVETARLRLGPVALEPRARAWRLASVAAAAVTSGRSAAGRLGGVGWEGEGRGRAGG